MKLTTLVLALLMVVPYGFARTKPQSRGDQTDTTTFEDSELTPIAASPCGSPGTHKSANSDTRTFIRFRNRMSKDVTIYWLDFEGKRDMRWTLKPGQGESLWTYLTHPFVRVDAKDRCAAVYMPRKEYGLVEFTE